MSALLFVLTAAVIALAPVPFVIFGPGQTVDLLGDEDGRAVVNVTGEATHETSGQLRMVTAKVTPVDGMVALPAVLYSWWSGAHEVLPDWAVYPAGVSAGDIINRDTELMNTSRQDAAAAGLRLAGIKVARLPVVVSVTDTGPAAGRLKPGDLILAVDEVKTPSEVEIRKAIGNRAVGDQVVFTVLRDREETQVRVSTVASKNQAGVPVVGIRMGMGYNYQPHVDIEIDPMIGGSSAGLIMALAVYNKVGTGDITAGRIVSGTGEIDGDGLVTQVGAIRTKIVTARQAGAQVFLLPEGNCSEVPEDPGLRVVPVASLKEAVDALASLAEPAEENTVRSCP